MKEAKKIKIIGENYRGSYNHTRVASRAIIIENNQLLTSYETKTDQYMIPGGGKEDNETDQDCCIREVSEETGKMIECSECILEIDEYYENDLYISKYYIGKIIGETAQKLTKREIMVGMEPKWIEVEEILKIFGKHDTYKENNEMRRGLYLREYTALEYIKKRELL